MGKREEQFLTRGVEDVYPSVDFLKKRLGEGKPLTMYLGIDPTGPTLHMGHAIVLRKMQQFQELGHVPILLIGDFTGMIGDPSDKSAARKRLTHKKVLENAAKYKDQASKFLRFNGAGKAQLKYNGKWLSKLSFEQVADLATHFTVQQMLQRDMFARRIKDGKDVYVHEFLYPVMQGYDSVAMDVDGEIGGNDQMFNMLAGRKLLKQMKKKEKFVITIKLLEDTAGVKMGKTEGNMITFEDGPDEMFGKVMRWTDRMVLPGFELLTSEPLKGLELKIKKDPRGCKAELARQIVSMFHGKDASKKASGSFDKLFKDHEVPRDMPEHKVKRNTPLIDALVSSGLASSKTDARRLIDGGGVKVDGRVAEGYEVNVCPGEVIQKGKRHFVRLVK